MTALADLRPAGLDLLIRPANTVTLTLEWPAGTLAGRTFSSTLDAVALAVLVAGDTMTVTADDLITGALDVGVPAAWVLLEDIDGTDEPVMVGTWIPSNGPAAIDAATVTVSAGTADVAVTLTGAVSDAQVAAIISGLSIDAATLAGLVAAHLLDRTNHTDTQLAATISDFAAAVGAAIPVAPSQTVFRVKNTTSQSSIVIDSLNIDLLTGYSGTVPDLPVPVVVMGLIPVSHSVTDAELNPVICKTVPAPATILDSLAMGFMCVTTIGKKGNCLVMCVLEPNTPCTVQLYLSGTGGTAAVPVQTYAPGLFMAWTL